MKILVIGGHLSPAVAFTQNALDHGHIVSYIGRQFTNRATQNKSPEAVIMKELKVAFDTYQSVKFNRLKPLSSIVKLPLILPNLITASKLISKHNPEVIVSFGSYIALPLTLAARTKGIPIVTHEQTAQAGLSNRIIARYAAAVAISFESSRPYFPPQKTHRTGHLLRKRIQHPPQSSSLFTSPPKKPIITVIGGSQGSLAINRSLKPIIPSLIKDYTLVHQVGSAHAGAEFKSFQALKRSLPERVQADYLPKKWILEPDLGWLYQNSLGFIARAGANTVAELYFHKVPAIMIPLPGAQANEQLLHATLFQKHRAGIVINQSDLTPPSLHSAVKNLKQTHQKMKKNIPKLNLTMDRADPGKLLQLAQTIAAHENTTHTT